MSRFEEKLRKRVLDVRWVGDMFWWWAKLKGRISGGRFNYLYWVDEDTRWGTKASLSCLLGGAVGSREPGGKYRADDFDIKLSVRARDGMYERAEHSGLAMFAPSDLDKKMAWEFAMGEAVLPRGPKEFWVPPKMEKCSFSPGRVAIRTKYGGVKLPHESGGNSFVNHVGRVCDKRRGSCPYADCVPVGEMWFLPASDRAEVAVIRERVGAQGANRGRPDVRFAGEVARETEAWGPPMYYDVVGRKPKFWEHC
jgi:hypothetical protein